jgi:hypothetical protein
VLEAKLPLAPVRGFGPAPLQQFLEYRSIEFPTAVLIGVGQRGTTRRCLDSQMPQLAFACGQALCDLPQGLGMPQLAEQHRHKLCPTVESPRVPLRSVFGDRCFKLHPWDEL